MPFDLAGSPASDADLLGVPRHLLVARALAALPEPLRDLVADVELADGGRFVHMGLSLDRVAWRAVWQRQGLPETRGSIAVRHGAPV